MNDAFESDSLALLGRALELARQGYPEDAADLLIEFVRCAEIPELDISVTEAGQITIDRPYDAAFIAQLQRIKGLRRDKEAGIWLVPTRGSGFGLLIALLESLSRPPCSALACSLGDAAAPSGLHLNAHRAFCTIR